jgi:type II secretory pathway pseudopilin PulG
MNPTVKAIAHHTALRPNYMSQIASLHRLQGRAAKGRRPAGFSMTEALISMGILALLAALALTSGYHFRTRSDARVCRGNIQAIYRAVNEYALDFQLAAGTTVTVSQLAPRYLPGVASLTCPATTGLTYSAWFIVNRVPTCPGGKTNHVWSPLEAPGL